MTDYPSPEDAGALARELITLHIHGEDDELHRRVKQVPPDDVHDALILIMVEALAHTWGDDPERWQAQLLEIAAQSGP